MSAATRALAALRHSIVVRTTLSVLLVLLLGIATLTELTQKWWREDLEHQLSEKQLSISAVLAEEVDREITEREANLKQIAAYITPAMIANQAEAQAYLAERRIFHTRFNAGSYIANRDGVAIASVPTELGRVGTSYIERDHVLAALTEGKTTLSQPVVGKKLGTPVVSMATPIRNDSGAIIGALVGVTDLSKPNFLDKVTRPYGRSGGFVLVSRTHRIIITATEKSRALEVLPAPGISPVLDRFLDGNEGHYVFVNPKGVEVLTAVKQIPSANWYLATIMPTAEAFAELSVVSSRMRSLGITLALFVSILMFWILRMQLWPLGRAAATLNALSESPDKLTPVPIDRRDEIGTMIVAFNRLLATLADREVALQRSADRAMAIIDSMPIGLAINDAERRITYLNPTFLHVIGYTLDDIPTLEAWWPRAYPDPEYQQWIARTWEDHRQAALNGNTPFEPIEARIRCKDGQDRIFMVGATPILGSLAVDHLVTFYDITELKQIQIELEHHRDKLEEQVSARTVQLLEAKDAAEAASRAKSTFLANMSHELRTPLTAIMGMTELALRRATDPKQRDHLGKSATAAHHLLGVINGILDLSRIESGRLVIEDKPFMLSDVVADTLRMQFEAARAKQISLTSMVEPDLQTYVLGDGTRVQQVLLNFVGNAIKFSGQGQVLVTARVVERSDDVLKVRMEVQDQGIGLTAEEQARLFTPFIQADDSVTRKYGGTGLGLAISRRLAHLMGGEVGVVSEPGHGATFWFELPLNLVPSPKVESPEPTSALEELRQRHGGRRILVAEDEPITREVVREWLENAQLVADVAENGEEAVAKVQQGDHALVLMDLQMPVMDGYAATRALRALPRFSRMPIIALTANAFEEDRQRCLEAGMNDHLAKPVLEADLHAVLLRWLDSESLSL